MKTSINTIIWNIGLLSLSGFAFYHNKSLWSFIILIFVMTSKSTSEKEDKGEEIEKDQ